MLKIRFLTIEKWHLQTKLQKKDLIDEFITYRKANSVLISYIGGVINSHFKNKRESNIP